jgi:hypothetical protein
MLWLSSLVLLTSVLLMLAGIALIFDAGIHFVRVLRAEARTRRR